LGTLFVIGRPLKIETLQAAMERLAARGEEIHVIFVDAGVGTAGDEKLMRQMGFAESLSCLSADAEIAEGVERMDYLGWVRLIEGCERVVSWT